MKSAIVIIFLCAAVEFCVVAQTDQIHFVSKSKTVAAYRQLYPQLTNMNDERLVLAIGTKHPEVLKTDSVLSNEFAAWSEKSPVPFLNENRAVAAPAITNITTLTGESYTGVKITKVVPDGLVISYSNGQNGDFVAKLYFENLPDSLKERFHYNPNQAADFRQRQLQSMDELRQRLTTDDQIAVNAENQRTDEGLVQRQIEQQQKIAAQQAVIAQQAAEAEQKQADAAMIQALKPPPPPVNVIQQNNNYGW
ncbi:MAG TPA: hypothetical protein VJT54_14800 [Verrucomicrobiae bacterium]|nr:hypothetical protein [Verrucomicrobiae bacterium]